MGFSVNISYHHSACPIDADFAFLQCGLVKLSSSEKVHSAVNFEVMHVHKIPQHFLPHLLRLALVSTSTFPMIHTILYTRPRPSCSVLTNRGNLQTFQRRERGSDAIFRLTKEMPGTRDWNKFLMTADDGVLQLSVSDCACAFGGGVGEKGVGAKFCSGSRVDPG